MADPTHLPWGQEEWGMPLILFYRFRRINPSKNIESKINKKLFYALREYRNLFFVIMGILFFTSIIKGTITTFLTVYLTNDGETLWYAGAALSIFQFAGAGGTFFSGTMSDKIGRRNVLIFASVINPILLLLFVYTTGIPAFIVLGLTALLVFTFILPSVAKVLWLIAAVGYIMIILWAFLESLLKYKSLAAAFLSPVTLNIQVFAYGFGLIKALWQVKVLGKKEASGFVKGYYGKKKK